MADNRLTKKLKVSKNRKKYWKKSINLKDVEDFLEEKRQDERFGGAPAEKTDDQLFVVQTRQTLKEVPITRSKFPALRCFQVLELDSSVAPPFKSPHLQGNKDTVKSPRRYAKKQKTSLVANASKKEESKKREPYDLWSFDDEAEVKRKAAKANVNMNYIPEIVTRSKVKVPVYRYQKPSLLPSVEVPHPGASYNPTIADHQDLLLAAHQVEEKRQKEEDHLDRVLTKMFPKTLPTEADYLQEMSAGLFDDKEEEEVDEDSGVECETKTWGKPVSLEDRKTKSDRNLEKVRKREKRKVQVEKLQKKRLNDLNRLKSLKKEIVKDETKSEERQKKREKQRADYMFRPHRLGPCKYVDPDLEIKLGEELPDNLRTLKIEGHLMEDRFKSLQRRNIIETRIRQKKQKKKQKIFVKRSHRD